LQLAKLEIRQGTSPKYTAKWGGLSIPIPTTSYDSFWKVTEGCGYMHLGWMSRSSNFIIRSSVSIVQVTLPQPQL